MKHEPPFKHGFSKQADNMMVTVRSASQVTSPYGDGQSHTHLPLDMYGFPPFLQSIDPEVQLNNYIKEYYSKIKLKLCLNGNVKKIMVCKLTVMKDISQIPTFH